MIYIFAILSLMGVIALLIESQTTGLAKFIAGTAGTLILAVAAIIGILRTDINGFLIILAYMLIMSISWPNISDNLKKKKIIDDHHWAISTFT